jgi:hypothetical protein
MTIEPKASRENELLAAVREAARQEQFLEVVSICVPCPASALYWRLHSAAC